MKDQAENLRSMVRELETKFRAQLSEFSPGRCRVIAVTSGKGGVGKTSLALGLAITLAKANYRVVLLDGDMGMANIDVVLGLYTKYDLSHVVKGEKRLQEIILKGPAGMKIIPGGSGVEELANIDSSTLNRLFKEITLLDQETDYLFIDTGAGISKQVMLFLQAAEEILLVATPEPTSLTDAYGLVKVFHRHCGKAKIKVIINMAKNKQEGTTAAQRLKRAAQSFLGVNLEILGCVHYDPAISNAIKRHLPYVLASPSAQASVDTIKIASVLGEVPVKPPSGVKVFLNNLVNLFT
mgnify:CR=1 FL=1